MSTSTETHTDWVSSSLAELPSNLTILEAAGVLRVSRRTLARYLADGRLSAKRVSDGHLLVPKIELARFMRGLDG